MQRAVRPILSVLFFFTAALGVSPAARADQCVVNAASFEAKVFWFKWGHVPVTNADKKPVIQPSDIPPQKTVKLLFNEESCVPGTDNIAIVTIVGADIARKAAIVALDTALVGSVLLCSAGAAAIDVVTAGAAAVGTGALCEALVDVSASMIVHPKVVPNTKELMGLYKPPTDGPKRVMRLYGSVFKPEHKFVEAKGPHVEK